MEPLRLSATNLGYVVDAKFCPRCFWVRTKCGFKLPYQSFPSIFSAIDSYSKKITHDYFSRHGRMPPWLAKLGDVQKPIKPPHHSRFFCIDDETNIKLTGVADEILQCANGSHVIVDYKTSRAHADALRPRYEVQLNAYAHIAENLGICPVSCIALVYYEPRTDIDVDDLDSVISSDGFSMAFTAKVVPLRLDADEMIPPLLKKVREIADLPKAPAARRDCRNCPILDSMLRLPVSDEPSRALPSLQTV